MPIQQFRYHADNLGYVIHDRTHAMAVDGGAVSAILGFLAEAALNLVSVTHTHRHPDHLTGTDDLIRETGARHLDFSGQSADTSVEVGRMRVQVMPTPGHTDDAVCFAAEDWLVTGDTLFNGTVGNCFSGDLEAFYHSILRLLAFPDDTRIYGGHDYVRQSMAAARRMEPENPDIESYLAAYDPYHVVSTLGAERRVNPYLRFDVAPMIALMTRRGLSTDTRYRRWLGVMSLE
ncbi:MAG: MBL fold metallo-hydrolase [Pseudomonadota bacterium]